MRISEHKNGDLLFSMNEFESIEHNIGRAISLMQILFSKNKQLNIENERLNNMISEQEKTIQTLKEEISGINKNTNNSTINKEKEEKVRFKIQQIFEKLESIEKLSNNNLIDAV